MMRQLYSMLCGMLALTLLATGCIPRADQISSERRVANYVEQGGKTGIVGKVFIKTGGAPLAGAYVNIYPDAISNLLGPSMFISLPTGSDGSYSLDVPAGTYYVVARKRLSGKAMGPLSPGDYYSEHQRVVTTVVPGKLAVVDMPLVVIKAPMFFKKEVVESQTGTGVRGKLVDVSGNPVPGGFATAYVDPEMRRLPDFASTLSDENGDFILYLPGAGTYYLGARIHAWDMPRPGEPYGRLGGDNPQPVIVEKGTFVEGLTIEMLPFDGEYKPGKSRRPI
ncbi:MSCRAMM family protein [Trichloromonas sp.]|uniref:MSCRAMM family protein n=1 Tax=Trichloromonas sp. TaxID=3069249 RepID=UPI003D81B699